MRTAKAGADKATFEIWKCYGTMTGCEGSKYIGELEVTGLNGQNRQVPLLVTMSIDKNQLLHMTVKDKDNPEKEYKCEIKLENVRPDVEFEKMLEHFYKFVSIE